MSVGLTKSLDAVSPFLSLEGEQAISTFFEPRKEFTKTILQLFIQSFRQDVGNELFIMTIIQKF